MLWLDSCFPLDKDCSDPGVHRGTCPGGESSTPTHLRQKYPNGWTSFANAAVGEIGSTLQEAPTPPPTPAPSGCFPSPGKNQPECNGQPEARCKFMQAKEKKCQWIPQKTSIPSPVPTSAPTFMTCPISAPTSAPTPSPTGICEQLCGRVNMRDKGQWCSNNSDSASCAQSYVNKNGKAKLCKWADSKCKADSAHVLQCGSLGSSCAVPSSSPTSAPTSMPTFASMTASTTKSTAGNCAEWCETLSKPWAKKCSWRKCAGCSNCDATTTTTSTVTTFEVCKPWCPECPMDWIQKCEWLHLCGGCPQCEHGEIRRLGGKDDEPSSTMVHI